MNDPATVLERSLRRDAAIRAAGHDPKPQIELEIIEFIVKHALYDLEPARQWLVERASTGVYGVRERIVEAIGPVSERGHAADAVAMFSSVVGLGDEQEASERRHVVLDMHSLLRPPLRKLLETSGLISLHPNLWGKCLVRLQSLLLLDEQREDAKRWGKRSELAETTEPGYHDRFHCGYYQREPREHDAWGIVAQTIEQGLGEAAALTEKESFCILAEELIASKWGLAICQPLVALYDRVRRQTERSWQHGEAVRLLCLIEVEGRHATFEWRRLLRRQLLPVISTEERIALLTRIRESQSDDRLRANELADFRKYAPLTQDEESEIDKERRDGRLVEPMDPRELRSIAEAVSFSDETPADRFIKSWPHAQDHASLRLLAETERIDGKATIGEVEASVLPRLDALNEVLKRPETDSTEWIGELLGWCARAVGDMKQWYRIKHEISQDGRIDADRYLQLLEEKAPWWENRVTAALERLKEPAPEDHAEYDSEQISWGSNDPVAGSLQYLDEVLAAPDSSRLDAYRLALADTIVRAWDGWADYTRGLAIAILRTYHWATNEDLAELLLRLLRAATHSRDVELSLRHLLASGQSGVSSLMRSLINRIDTLTDPSDVAYLIGQVIGNAVARCRGDGEGGNELPRISELYDDLGADRSQGQSVRYSLIASIEQGARSHLSSLDRLDRRHAELWLSIVTWGLSDWLAMGDERNDDLPISPVSAMSEMRWDCHEQRFLLEGMADILMRIIQEADLGAFYEVHYELKKLLKADQSDQSVVLDRAIRLSLEPTLVAFCRASAKRVAQWRKQQRTTNDLAYVFSLSGNDTSELITLVFETATDREHARRQLAPIVDILADAGLHDTSSRLRRTLRHS